MMPVQRRAAGAWHVAKGEDHVIDHDRRLDLEDSLQAGAGLPEIYGPVEDEPGRQAMAPGSVERGAR